MTNLSIYGGTYSTNLGTEYDVQARRWQQRQQVFGDIDFKSNLFMSGTDGDEVLQRIENNIEGSGWGDGISGNLLSWDRYVTDNNDYNDVVFQSKNGGTYTNINFGQGWYSQMNERQFAYSTGAFGTEADLANKPYDLLIFGQDAAQFVDYKFSGFADGQTRTVVPFANFDNTRWSKNTSFVSQEYNPFAVDYNPYSIGEAAIANQTLQQIMDNASQWMSYSDEIFLSQFDENSSGWRNALQNLVMTKFDQGNELIQWYGNSI